MNLYVANLPYSTKEEELLELFEPFGAVTSARIIRDNATKRSRGFAFVEMPDDKAGQLAIIGTNGRAFNGRDLVVKEARPHTKVEQSGSAPRVDQPDRSRSHIQALSTLDVFIDPGTAPPEKIAELLSSLSDIYRAYCGDGINFTLDDVRVLTHEHVTL
ncbi:MAG: hypothetical protein KDC00_12760 [Flavobacteriales bacterium]|nr:hypothetical protein [Flavobacteriales bacterium]